jgi:hypothetical protein
MLTNLMISLFFQHNRGGSYPSELDVFVGKRMLFKVEITKGNLLHNWRNYGVKRTSDDKELITRFITHHQIEVVFFNMLNRFTKIALIYLRYTDNTKHGSNYFIRFGMKKKTLLTTLFWKVVGWNHRPRYFIYL